MDKRHEVELTGSVTAEDLAAVGGPGEGGAGRESGGAVLAVAEAELAGVSAAGWDLRESTFERVVFDSVDLARADLSECRFRRCLFRRCDLAGVSLGRSYLGDVVFADCRLSFANFFEASLDNVIVEGGLMREAEVTRTRCRDVTMSGVDLSRTMFSHLVLAAAGDLDICGSVIDATRGLATVSGVMVDAAQAALISAALLKDRGVLVAPESGGDGSEVRAAEVGSATCSRSERSPARVAALADVRAMARQ